MDISDFDVKAKDDKLITTPVLTKATFESPKKTSNGNIDKHQWYRYLSNTIVKFRQGLGRLVRRPGRENMHVLYFDALYHKRSRGMFKSILRRTYSS
ncbi:hypothetical protein [Vibrio mediterranei]|uniref:hypothetical protein n=1 Tax=Vibrio mediterranei TaxID=689 RepID=UPI00406976A4